MTILFPLLAVVIGVLMYMICKNNKLEEIGRLTFFCGLLVFLFGSPGVVSLLR